MRSAPARYLVLYVALSYAVSVLATAFINFRALKIGEFTILYPGGPDPEFWRILLWQALTYFVWIPFAAWTWTCFRRMGLTGRALARYGLVGALLIPLHSVLTVLVDVKWSAPGAIDLKSLAAQRALLDTLIYASFGFLAIAAHFHRKAAEEASAAAEVRSMLESARAAAADQPEAAQQLLVAVGSRQVVVRVPDVEWFGSAANYVVVNSGDQEGLIRDSIQAIEGRVDPNLFARVHRRTIVNLTKVRTVEYLSDGSWRLTMASGVEIDVSRSYRDVILKRLGRKPGD
jgi:hypothetical protein